MPITQVVTRDLRLDDLDEGTLDRVTGEQALADALRSIREEGGRAAEAYRAVVRSLAEALEARDGYTGAHSEAVHRLSVAVARRLGLDRKAVAEVEAVALLHDIGKIGIPDHVLHKQGALDEDEWTLMRQHPVIGERILRPLPGLARVAEAVRHEHECWDGTGYPDGLAGAQIPLASRIVLACDAWSALVSDRPYRTAHADVDARAELTRCAGSQFDPAVVAALLECLDEGVESARDGADPGDLLATVGEDRESRRLEREVQALIAIASMVATAETFDDVLESAADEACAAVDADSLSVSRWEADARVLRTIVNVGELADWEQRRPADETYRIDDDDALRLLLLDGESYVTSVDDPDAYPAELKLLAEVGKHSCVAVPITLGGVPWGELWAARGNAKPVFDRRDIRFLQTVAGQLAAAAGRTELYARMADLAFRDALTGVGNRRSLEERLELALHEAVADGRDLVVLLCDLDNLKELNDSAGHQSGDDALRRVAEALLAEAEEPGAVYRLGGDEFCLVLPDGGLERGKLVGERVITRLAEGEGRPVSVSCGVAALSMGATKPADLLRAADTAQYTAKRTGRGQVCLAEADAFQSWRSGPERRRRHRRREAGTLDVGTYVDTVTAALDGPFALAPAQQRLEEVAAEAARVVDAARTAVSFVATGDLVIAPVAMFDLRRSRAWRREFGADGHPYVITDYPATEAILGRGGAFVVSVSDPDADPAEKAILEEFSVDEVLVVAAPTPGGVWLLEVYGDAQSDPLASISSATRLLTVVAVSSATDLPVPRIAVA